MTSFIGGIFMKEIRLCDDTEVRKIANLCNDNSLGIEIQGFYNPSLIVKKQKD